MNNYQSPVCSWAPNHLASGLGTRSQFGCALHGHARHNRCAPVRLSQAICAFRENDMLVKLFKEWRISRTPCGVWKPAAASINIVFKVRRFPLPDREGEQ